mmetsp:Transcript_86424/g.252895  ORF Transcript_86424/g.252895 Transcript_86424/m.252895 type:complete len:259 (+) Transcript_86424:1097-1873(+)
MAEAPDGHALVGDRDDFGLLGGARGVQHQAYVVPLYALQRVLQRLSFERLPNCMLLHGEQAHYFGRWSQLHDDRQLLLPRLCHRGPRGHGLLLGQGVVLLYDQPLGWQVLVLKLKLLRSKEQVQWSDGATDREGQVGHSQLWPVGECSAEAILPSQARNVVSGVHDKLLQSLEAQRRSLVSVRSIHEGVGGVRHEVVKCLPLATDKVLREFVLRRVIAVVRRNDRARIMLLERAAHVLGLGYRHLRFWGLTAKLQVCY